MGLFTIGFTKKSAETFFKTLRHAAVKRVVDVRLNNVSQLAGFSKKDDLRYFLKEICGIDYSHVPGLAPTQALLDEYRKQGHGWPKYEKQFLRLLRERRAEKLVSKDLMERACLLCSEEKPDMCHRRVVAEYLKEKWGVVEIIHL
jgi:uncharacterized protein (DUF488 family)